MTFIYIKTPKKHVVYMNNKDKKIRSVSSPPSPVLGQPVVSSSRRNCLLPLRAEVAGVIWDLRSLPKEETSNPPLPKALCHEPQTEVDESCAALSQSLEWAPGPCCPA